ncbi:MAG: FKBP-type peptidyl-prolyl cis-trans isomerase [Steroidobacteraceae bacterium]|jgi:FKBP-type peptidyl-prolyl cis-trans isomerase
MPTPCFAPRLPRALAVLAVAAPLAVLMALIALPARAASAPPASSAPGTAPAPATAAAPSAAAGPKSDAGPKNEDDKTLTLYTLGVLISHNLESFQLSSAEFRSVMAGLTDGYNHHVATIDIDAYTPKVQALQRTRVASLSQHEKEVGQAYLEKAAAVPGAQKTQSGLVYQQLTEGNGPNPQRTDRVLVNYEGKLIDGTVFDSSIKRGQPATFNLSAVIPCWTEALQLMKAGGKSRIVCPAILGYGDRGAPPIIKPGSTLVFDVELISIVNPSAAPPAPARPPSN